ncbi:MAG: YhcH/YjgK/YiaL family protein [Prevotella sp.]|nr:YhcH/YjgK/YiaL family protein [Prevotella sp.]
MVVDTLDNLSKYEAMNPLFKEVIKFLQENDLNKMEEGKYPICGEDLFLNLTTAKGKTPDEAVMETHNKMLDIQIPLNTPETYGYTPRVELPEAEYNEAKDITKIPGVIAQNYVTCNPGMFAIFFPEDGHAPCISMEAGIKKAIFKVKA